MPTVTFVEADGARHDVAADSGLSLMEAARNNAVPGILADCGGSCACGTCRVIVDPGWRDRVAAPSEIEADTLEAEGDPLPGMRLSCQIMLSDALDGLVVTLPESQF